MYDVEAVRRDFPILERRVHGKALVYLDSAATSQKPRAVIDAVARFYSESNANIHRGVHTLAEEATALYDRSRARVARFIGAPTPRSIVFTRNTTEAINLVAYAWARRRLRPGDEVLVSQLEHHSNLVPWHLVAEETGARVRALTVGDDGELDLAGLDAALGPRTRLVAVTAMSNVLGTFPPVAEIVRRAHAAGAMVLLDGAQLVPHAAVDVVALGCDFMAFSAHKMLGPMGVGVLFGRLERLEEMGPFLGGGDMIREVFEDRSSYAEVPTRFEAGTPNVADVVGFEAAIDYLERLGMDAVRAHERQLTALALRRLAEQPDVTIHGPRDAARRGGVVSFALGDIHPHDVGTIVDREGVAIRVGHHCAQPLMRRLGVAATCRASFYVYTTEAEVERLVDALEAVRSVFGVTGRASPARAG
jgi:cysteine desulfurase/selenocysteine lyase